jgi:hypothetical protein
MASPPDFLFRCGPQYSTVHSSTVPTALYGTAPGPKKLYCTARYQCTAVHVPYFANTALGIGTLLSADFVLLMAAGFNDNAVLETIFRTNDYQDHLNVLSQNLVSSLVDFLTLDSCSIGDFRRLSCLSQFYYQIDKSSVTALTNTDRHRNFSAPLSFPVLAVFATMSAHFPI